ncbi:MAG: cytochrome c3 family protein [Phycisphaeraceae bacterium]|nr:cytochrome c3 family protein [Phycisphaeraceae bacterium]
MTRYMTVLAALLIASSVSIAHSAEKRSSSAAPAAPVSASTTNSKAKKPAAAVDNASCVTADCHANVKNYPVLHGPLTVNACDACHRPLSAADHTFELTRQKTDLCTFCHTIEMGQSVVVHEPLKRGQCVECHNPHGGASRAMLATDSANNLCKQCHQDVMKGKKSVHGPVAAGACGACHQPHSSNYPKLLNAQGTQLCLTCHVSTATEIRNKRVVHGPVAVDCQACHDAHASDQPMMLRDEPAKLCASCHETIKATIAGAKTQHEAVTTSRACLNCHEAHASDFPSILRGSMLELCMECHNQEIALSDGRKLANIKAVLDTGTSLHGPVAQANCAACHLIHGGDNFRLLVREYPPQFYAPFKEESYALCFMCHDPQVVRDEKTTALTNFRNGQENLHYLHVHRDKGRTCRACHETHASANDKHIRAAVPYGTGGWMLPLNYQKSEDGGRCAPGCHLPYEYNRRQPVSYPASQPAATSTQGANP